MKVNRLRGVTSGRIDLFSRLCIKRKQSANCRIGFKAWRLHMVSGRLHLQHLHLHFFSAFFSFFFSFFFSARACAWQMRGPTL